MPRSWQRSAQSLLYIGLCGLLFCGVLPAFAHGTATGDNALDSIAFDQELNAQVDLNLAFRDENNQAVTLGDYLKDKPAVMMLGYYHCEMLCSLALPALVKSVAAVNGFTPGKDFEILIPSIDPKETPVEASARKSDFMAEDAPGWHFLTGQPEAIDSLADTVGFHYTYDPEQNEFAHPSGLVFIAPGGKITRYIFGIDYDPETMRLNLVDATGGKTGSPVEQLLLRCYHYDPVTGKYTLAIENVLRAAGHRDHRPHRCSHFWPIPPRETRGRHQRGR